MLRKKPLIGFLISIAIGCSVWFFSQYLTGTDLPWNTSNYFYFFILVGAGTLTGFFAGIHAIRLSIGILLGQIIAMAVKGFLDPAVGANFFQPVAAIYLLAYIVPCFIALMLGISISKIFFKDLNQFRYY